MYRLVFETTRQFEAFCLGGRQLYGPGFGEGATFDPSSPRVSIMQRVGVNPYMLRFIL